MKFAHSLGFPHYNVMLASMTALELSELYVFFSVERKKQIDASIEAEDRNIMRFFDQAEQIQKFVKEVK